MKTKYNAGDIVLVPMRVETINKIEEGGEYYFLSFETKPTRWRSDWQIGFEAREIHSKIDPDAV